MWQERPRFLYFGLILTAACFILWLQIRPYGVLFTLILTFWIYKTKCPNLTIIPPLTITSKFETTYQRFIQLRQDQPRLCCTIISAGLAALAVLGHIVSGSSIVVFGLMMAAIIFSRHKITILKEINIDPIPFSSKIDRDIDEFLPEENDTNMLVLQTAGEKAVLLYQASSLHNTHTENSDMFNTDDDNDLELPTDLILPESIPEIDEHTDSSEDDECLLCPAVATQLKHHPQYTDIEFQSGYFNQNSSSSDDDSIIKGLHFRDFSLLDDQVDSMKNQHYQHKQSNKTVPVAESNQNNSGFPVSTIVSDLVTWGTETIANNSKSVTQAVQQHLMGGSIGGGSGGNNLDRRQTRLSSDSSDDSEFEILNTDELSQT